MEIANNMQCITKICVIDRVQEKHGNVKKKYNPKLFLVRFSASLPTHVESLDDDTV